jgi:phage tail sheath protein FI
MNDLVFEPRIDRLWDCITRKLTAYLGDLAKNGAWAGPLDDEAFYVNCDAETNRPEARQSSKMVTGTGLRPAAPAGFIVIRIIHRPAGVGIAGP